jgi:hypothetical protein
MRSPAKVARVGSGRKSVLPFVLGGVAMAGTLAAHFVDYYLFAPDPQHRAALLHATGHGYLAHLVPLAVLWGLLAAATTIWGGSTRARGERDQQPRFVPTATVLALAQVAGFALLEIGERVVSGAGFEHAWPQLFALGIFVQTVVAIAGAIILILLDRGAEKVAALLQRLRASQRCGAIQTRSTGRRLIPRLIETSITGRGPPFAVAHTP